MPGVGLRLFGFRVWSCGFGFSGAGLRGIEKIWGRSLKTISMNPPSGRSPIKTLLISRLMMEHGAPSPKLPKTYGMCTASLASKSQ